MSAGISRSEYPENSTALAASSGNVANAAAVATITPSNGKKAFISGFIVTAAGATAGLPVTVTVTGLVGGTHTYIFSAPVGALIGANPLVIQFPISVPAIAVDTNIVVTCPALGLGNTNASVNAFGYQI